MWRLLDAGVRDREIVNIRWKIDLVKLRGRWPTIFSVWRQLDVSGVSSFKQE
jgi:hypothetical protein